MNPPTDLTTLWESAWNLLQRGAADGKHPYATPVVATVSPAGVPSTRTLVLRKIDRAAGELWCYTDRRSGKAADLDGGNRLMAWTFWDRKQRIQFSCHGETRWLSGAESRERFRALPKHSRKAYATITAPGFPLTAAGDGLPEDWEAREQTATEYAADNFGILITRITRATVLRLGREGHLRLRAQRVAEREGWDLSWVTP